MKDIILNEDFSLKTENGDFVVGEADNQAIKLLLLTHKGGDKQFPLTGVGITDFLNSNINLQELKVLIIKELELDEFQDVNIDDNLKIQTK